MLNGRYFSFLLSIVIHLVLLLVLFSLPYKAPQISTAKKKTALKSYLYHKPKPISIKQVAIIKENKQKTNKPKLKEQTINKKPSLIKKIATATKVEKKQQKFSKTQVTSAKTVKKIDAIEQLANFKSQLNRQILQEEFSKYKRPQNLSAMGVLPKPVPHVKIIEDDIIKKEKSTTNYASDIAIIKLDDGRCILKQDLSTVGMVGITAVSGFNCGRTKMEKAFSAHMDKVLYKMK